MINKFQGPTQYLSNFWSAPVVFEGKLYLNNEAAFQAAKCKHEHDREVFGYLRAHMAQHFGQIVQSRPDWDAVMYDVMLDIIRDKFTRNAGLRARLIATGDEPILDTTKGQDIVWRNCTCSPCLHTQCTNVVGEILMRVRLELQTKTGC